MKGYAETEAIKAKEASVIEAFMMIWMLIWSCVECWLLLCKRELCPIACESYPSWAMSSTLYPITKLPPALHA